MRFLSEITVGEKLNLGSYTFSEEEIVRFGEKYDRQDYHMNPERAKNSVFGGIIASGWHTTAIYMKFLVAHFQDEHKRLLNEGKNAAKISASPGIEDIKWPIPVHAGDTITFHMECTATRKLKSRPGWGLMSQLTEAFNQNGDLVLTMAGHSILEWEDKSNCE